MHGNETQSTMVMISRIVRSGILCITDCFIDAMAVFKNINITVRMFSFKFQLTSY